MLNNSSGNLGDFEKKKRKKYIEVWIKRKHGIKNFRDQKLNERRHLISDDLGETLEPLYFQATDILVHSVVNWGYLTTWP